MSTGRNPRDVADRLYLAILSRYPTEAERAKLNEYSAAGKAKGREVALDLVRALVNSTEFLYRH